VPEPIPDMPKEVLTQRLISGGNIHGKGDKAFKFQLEGEIRYLPRTDNEKRFAVEPISIPCVRDKCMLWSDTKQDCKLGLIADQLGSVLQLAGNR